MNSVTMERGKAQEIMDSDHLWSQLNADEKISVFRVSMGLPPSVDYSIQTTGKIEQLSNKEHELKRREDLSLPIAQPCDQLEDRTLFVRIHLEKYFISCNVLEQVFSRFGILESIEILGPDSEFASRIKGQPLKHWILSTGGTYMMIAVEWSCFLMAETTTNLARSNLRLRMRAFLKKPKN